MAQAHRHLRCVPAPATELRALYLANWAAARRCAVNQTVALNAVSGAGMLLETHGDAEVALSKVVGSDDWAISVRIYLRRVVEEERGRKGARR